MSAKILERLRKKALDLVMDNKPDEVRETLEQIKTLEEMMAASTKKQEGIESIKTADTLEQRPVLDLVTQRLNKEQELLKVQSDRAQKLKNKGVNDPYYKKYDEGSIFSGANTYDDYLELIEDYAQREANYLGSRADYKGVPYENRLEIALYPHLSIHESSWSRVFSSLAVLTQSIISATCCAVRYPCEAIAPFRITFHPVAIRSKFSSASP